MPKSARKQYFSNDLKALLYAYGDSPAPNVDTIQTLEDVLTVYMADFLHEANRVRKVQHKAKLNVDHLKVALRHEPTKLGRVFDLQDMDRQITMAKKMFDDAAGKPTKEKEKEEKKERKGRGPGRPRKKRKEDE